MASNPHRRHSALAYDSVRYEQQHRHMVGTA
jgi:hypothetical protein